jgi:hypothetical protein
MVLRRIVLWDRFSSCIHPVIALLNIEISVLTDVAGRLPVLLDFIRPLEMLQDP